MIDQHLQRAQHLLSQGRTDMAIKELRLALGVDPNSSDAHALLALCLRDNQVWQEATDHAEKAVGLGPDTPFYHYVLAEVWLGRKRFDRARAAFEEALRLEPDNPAIWARKGALELFEKKWSAALEAAERALALDPDNVDAGNVRATALNFMGRHSESAAAAEDTLRRAPDDADSHASRGWTCLHRGEAKEAVEHFREALRLEPENEWARRGIAEALKARNILYRWLLRYFLWMARLPARVQLALVIGLLIFVRITSNIGQSNPEWAPYLQPILYVYVGFVIITWCGTSFANLILRLHPLGRHALDADERHGATAVGLTLLVGLGSFVGGLAMGSNAAVFLGVHLIFWMLPVSAIFQCEQGWPRLAMLAVAAALLGPVAAGTVSFYNSGHAGQIGGSALLFIALSTWVAGALSQARVQH